jgi:hypothetical protein
VPFIIYTANFASLHPTIKWKIKEFFSLFLSAHELIFPSQGAFQLFFSLCSSFFHFHNDIHIKIIMYRRSVLLTLHAVEKWRKTRNLDGKHEEEQA